MKTKVMTSSVFLFLTVAAFLVCGAVVPGKLALGILDESVELDSCLMAISLDPGLLYKIDQEEVFNTGQYTNILQKSMGRANYVYPLIMESTGATKTTVSVCAADGRVYFLNGFADHDVLGWIASPRLTKKQEKMWKMTVWIVPKPDSELPHADDRVELMAGKLRMEAALNSNESPESVFEKLSIDTKRYEVSLKRSGAVLQLDMSILSKGSSVSKNSLIVRALRFDRSPNLSFWPPETVEPLDPALSAIAYDPGLLAKIDQKDIFIEAAYSNVLQWTMSRARKAFPLLMDDRGAKKSVASVCAADGRVYFEHRFNFYRVWGWISIDQLVAPEEQGRMVVQILSSMVDEGPESKKLRAKKGHAVMQAASAVDISDDLVCKYLQFDREKYKAKARRKYSTVEIELSLNAAESDAETPASNPLPKKLIRDGVSIDLPFWPPEKKANSPSANENADE